MHQLQMRFGDLTQGQWAEVIQQCLCSLTPLMILNNAFVQVIPLGSQDKESFVISVWVVKLQDTLNTLVFIYKNCLKSKAKYFQ